MWFKWLILTEIILVNEMYDIPVYLFFCSVTEVFMPKKVKVQCD
jgi:hypothetical protein